MKRRPGDIDRWVADTAEGMSAAPGVKYNGKKRAKQLREAGRQKDQRSDHKRRAQARRLSEIRAE